LTTEIRGTILVADDDPAIRLLVAATLASLE
jgi:hypothetical protein